ncbi:MAG: hypothetical protein IRZ18_08225 [Clostridia bacterium]|nr:hypothetical protein [Clostridia bacterium]
MTVADSQDFRPVSGWPVHDAQIGLGPPTRPTLEGMPAPALQAAGQILSRPLGVHDPQMVKDGRQGHRVGVDVGICPLKIAKILGQVTRVNEQEIHFGDFLKEPQAVGPVSGC